MNSHKKEANPSYFISFGTLYFGVPGGDVTGYNGKLGLLLQCGSIFKHGRA